MADQTLSPTLDPFSTTKPRENSPVGGKMGFDGYEEGESDLRKLPEYVFSTGSIPFNKVKETLIDTGEAVGDLFFKKMIGLGAEDEALSKIEGPIYGEGGVDEQKIKAEQRKIQVLNTRPLEVYKQLADEALMNQQVNEQVRVLGGTMTQEDADLTGSRLELMANRSSIHWVALKRREVRQQVTTQQVDQSATEVSGQGKVDHVDKALEREGHWARNPG